jgi:hypothetical protein
LTSDPTPPHPAAASSSAPTGTAASARQTGPAAQTAKMPATQPIWHPERVAPSPAQLLETKWVSLTSLSICPYSRARSNWRDHLPPCSQKWIADTDPELFTTTAKGEHNPLK